MSIIVGSTSIMAQKTYHVNLSKGNDLNDGLKWSSSFKNLQTAIDSAKAGDSIFVAAGTYTPTKKIADVYGGEIGGKYTNTPTNNRHRSFLLNKDLKIYGGFPSDASDATTTSSRDWKTNQTILSGDFNNDDGDDFENTDENALHVVTLLNATSATMIDGFYIMGGGGTDSASVYINGIPIEYSCGGGIYAISNNPSSPTISNAVIRDNKVEGDGGGFFNYSNDEASPKISFVTMTHNVANGRGGAFYNSGNVSKPNLSNVDISGNQSTTGGGGFLCVAEKSCNPVFSNTLFSGNKSKRGGGTYIRAFEEEAEPVFTNVTACGNYGQGGGIAIVSDAGIAKPILRNTVIWGNKGDSYNNIYVDGTIATNPSYTCCLVEGEDLGSTNLAGDTDPKFANPVSADLAPTFTDFGNYQLSLSSPLINKGDNSVIVTTTDLNGQTRIYSNAVDIGAYESQGTEPMSNESIFSEKTIWSYHGHLYVRISQPATMRIYAINGMLIKQTNNLGTGTYEFDLQQGYYLVTLSTGETAKIFIR